MIIPLIFTIVLALQCIGLIMAKKKSEDIQSIFDYLIRFNIRAGASAFYLIAVIWIAMSLAEIITIDPELYYLFFGLLFFAGTTLSYKLFSHFKNSNN